MEKIVNLTPHDIHIFDEYDALVKTFPKSGKVARMKSDTPQTMVGHICGIVPVYSPQSFDGVEWPDIDNDTTGVIVSLPVGEYCGRYREYFSTVYGGINIFGPDSGVVKDTYGQIAGTKRLVKYF